MKFTMWAGVLLAVSLQTQAAKSMWFLADTLPQSSGDLARTLQTAQKIRGVRLANEDTPPPECHEFPTLRVAKGRIMIVKTFIEKVGDKFSVKSEPVCEKDLDIRMLDLRQEGNCYRGQGTECDTEVDGKKMKVGVSVAMTYETKAYPGEDSPARDVKAMGSSLYVVGEDHSFSDFQTWEISSFSTAEVSLADATLHMNPPKGQCSLIKKPDGSTEQSCTYRPVTFDAKLNIEDAP